MSEAASTTHTRVFCPPHHGVECPLYSVAPYVLLRYEKYQSNSSASVDSASANKEAMNRIKSPALVKEVHLIIEVLPRPN